MIRIAALLLLAGCGESIPKPWAKTEGRQEVVVDPATGQVQPQGQATVATAGPTAAAAAGGDALPPVDCEATYDTPAGETVGTLTCGGTLLGSTRVGAMRWGDDFYQRAFCTPHRRRYDESPEAIYRLVVPPDTEAVVQLESPCADLDLVAVAWRLDGVPTVDHVNRVAECEMDTKTTGGRLRLTTVEKEQVYLVAVDGKEGDEGNFRLSVTCGTYR